MSEEHLSTTDALLSDISWALGRIADALEATADDDPPPARVEANPALIDRETRPGK